MSGPLFYLILFAVTCIFGQVTRTSRRRSAPQTAPIERRRTITHWH